MPNIKIRVSLRTYELDDVTIDSYCDFTFMKEVPFIPHCADLIYVCDRFFKVSNAVLLSDTDFMIACVPHTCDDESSMLETYAAIKKKHDVFELSTNRPDTPGYYLIYRIISDIIEPDLSNEQDRLLTTDLLMLILEMAEIDDCDSHYVRRYLEIVLKNKPIKLSRSLMIWSRDIGLEYQANSKLLDIDIVDVANRWKKLKRKSINILPPLLRE